MGVDNYRKKHAVFILYINTLYSTDRLCLLLVAKSVQRQEQLFDGVTLTVKPYHGFVRMDYKLRVILFHCC